ncbi:MAG: hypothetical protein ACXQTR_04050 [Candidatus Methanospirareceae archaeon]
MAWKINYKYYGDIHFVWCTPDFGSSVSKGNPLNNPSSAQVLWRYKDLDEATKSGDLHSSAISKNRMGLLQGVEAKYAEEVIDEDQRDALHFIIENTECIGFRPLIYAMAYGEVKDITSIVQADAAAGPSSTEYIIEKLPGSMFTYFSLDRDR